MLDSIAPLLAVPNGEAKVMELLDWAIGFKDKEAEDVPPAAVVIKREPPLPQVTVPKVMPFVLDAFI